MAKISENAPISFFYAIHRSSVFRYVNEKTGFDHVRNPFTLTGIQSYRESRMRPMTRSTILMHNGNFLNFCCYPTGVWCPFGIFLRPPSCFRSEGVWDAKDNNANSRANNTLLEFTDFTERDANGKGLRAILKSPCSSTQYKHRTFS